MKYFVLVALIAVFARTVVSYPAAADKDVELVPSYSTRSRQNPFGTGVVDVQAGVDDDDDDDYGWLGGNFHSVMNQFNAMMDALRNRWRNLYDKTIEDALKNGNTTSTVEIINGHKVIRNQTVYEDPNTIFKSVVIHVVPSDEDVDGTGKPESTPKNRGETYTPEPDTEPVNRKKDREPLGDSVENEVNAEEVSNLNIETLDGNDVPSNRNKYKYETVAWNGDAQDNFDDIEIVEPFSPPEAPPKEKIVDLSNDIDVNYILADQGAPINPDAEFIDVDSIPKFEKIVLT